MWGCGETSGRLPGRGSAYAKVQTGIALAERREVHREVFSFLEQGRAWDEESNTLWGMTGGSFLPWLSSQNLDALEDENSGPLHQVNLPRGWMFQQWEKCRKFNSFLIRAMYKGDKTIWLVHIIYRLKHHCSCIGSKKKKQMSYT